MSKRSPKVGTCTVCNGPARSKQSKICTECLRIKDRDRMREKYAKLIAEGYTTNGCEPIYKRRKPTISNVH